MLVPYSKRVSGADPGPRHSAVSPQVTEAINSAVGLPLLFTRPAVTSPAAEHHRQLAGTKLYCLATEEHVCKQLAHALGSAAAGIRTRNLLIASRILSESYVVDRFKFSGRIVSATRKTRLIDIIIQIRNVNYTVTQKLV